MTNARRVEDIGQLRLGSTLKVRGLGIRSSKWLSSTLVSAVLFPTLRPWCFIEAVTAAFRGKDVVGIETEDLTGDDLARAPPILHERQRVRLRDGDDRAWREILEALDRSGLDPDDWFSIPPNVGPYPGLVAFDEKDPAYSSAASRKSPSISASSTPCAGRTGRRCW